MRFLIRVSIIFLATSFTCDAKLMNLTANDFATSQHWQFNEQDKQAVLLGSAPAEHKLTEQDSLIVARAHYGDAKLSLQFKLAGDDTFDLLMMGRYALRLSLDEAGTIMPSWDEYNTDNPTRSFGGATSQTEVSLAAGEWHQLELAYRTPRYDVAHNKTDSFLLLSAKINGMAIHKNQLIVLPAKNAIHHWEERGGPLAFDAVSGTPALRNIIIQRVNYDELVYKIDENGDISSNQAELSDLVRLGAEAFTQHGCKECHSLQADDKAVKSGPNLFALFQFNSQKRQVKDAEGHSYEVSADYQYLKRSIRLADEELAVYKSGSKAGEAYLPIMPRYSEERLDNQSIVALHAYLKTYNQASNQGPIEHLVVPEAIAEYDPMQDALQFVVQDRIRIQRGPMPKVSGRAIHVGHPNGIHYSFDPRILAVARIWNGGFLETSGELKGRGGKGFDLGYQAIELPLGEAQALLRPLNQAGKFVDFSFKEPLMGDTQTMRASIYSKESFEQRIAEQNAKFLGYYKDSRKPLAAVSFRYQIEQNTIAISHDFDTHGKVKVRLSGNLLTPQKYQLNTQFMKNIEVSTGKVTNGIWTLAAGSYQNATLLASIDVVDSNWTPTQTAFSYHQQPVTVLSGSAQLPQGYSVENWYAPKDNAGREQLFEALALARNEQALWVGTRTAGIWRVKDKQWQLFAEGIFDNLGLIVNKNTDNEVIVGSKAEITRIVDDNGDGIADHYQTIFDGFANMSNYHAYLHGPVLDDQGNYIIALNLAHGNPDFHDAGGGVMASHGGYLGWILAISPDGQHKLIANGMRSPAGLGIAPDGSIFYADNQGDFMGSSKIFKVEQGDFFGHPAGLIDEPNMTPDSPEIQWPEVIKRKAKAAIVVAHGRVANSLGNPVWDMTQGQFGDFMGQMFIGDQTLSNLSRVIFEQVEGHMQGVMIPFASGLESGVMRPLFLQDASLLLGQTGRGWNAKGGNVAALQRIIPDVELLRNNPSLMIHSVSVTASGFALQLTNALPKNYQISNISIESWTYRDAPAYGSDELGHQSNTISKVQIASDRRSVNIELEDTDIPMVHSEQTARIYKISIGDGLGQQAYYSLHSFR